MEKKLDREYTVLDVDFLTVFTTQKFKSLRSDYGRPLGVKNTRVFETVVKTPGLSSPCTMECGEGLLTAFGVGFTPHIQRKAGADLRLRPHPVDTLLPLA